MTEEWRPIVGFDGYSVSDHGRVRSERRFVAHKGSGGGLWVRERILKPRLNRAYWVVNLCKSGSYSTRTVATLVAAAFIGPRPAGLEVCHNDGNGQNNRSGNLRYDTHKANMADKARHGTLGRGETIGTALLSDEAVRFIRANKVLLQEELAELFNVSQPTISMAKNRKSWGHLA